jgi:hypothetical protein
MLWKQVNFFLGSHEMEIIVCGNLSMEMEMDRKLLLLILQSQNNTATFLLSIEENKKNQIVHDDKGFVGILFLPKLHLTGYPKSKRCDIECCTLQPNWS